jgi:hypothetical protein
MKPISNPLKTVALTAVIGMAFATVAQAVFVPIGTAFPVVGHDSEPGYVITWDGTSATVTHTAIAGVPIGPYDGSDDTYIAVKNTSPGGALSSMTLSAPIVAGNEIFAFDSDGGESTAYLNTHNTYGPTGYEGPGTSFSGISADKTTGTVNFTGGLGAGEEAYFFLETDIASAVGNGTFIPTVPDGGSTLMLLGGVLAGLASIRRRFIQ